MSGDPFQEFDDELKTESASIQPSVDDYVDEVYSHLETEEDISHQVEYAKRLDTLKELIVPQVSETTTITSSTMEADEVSSDDGDLDIDDSLWRSKSL
ncbi:hypothetical protein P9112_007230 [Eukaryota sp. TZLM1-RC]